MPAQADFTNQLIIGDINMDDDLDMILLQGY